MPDLAVDGADDLVQALARDVLGPLADEVLSHVPVIRVAYAGTRAVAALRERAFQKRLLMFLVGVKELDDESRKKLTAGSSSAEFREEVLEPMLLALDRLDEVEKAKATARFLRAVAMGDIDRRSFREHMRALEQINWQDLPALIALHAGTGPTKDDAVRLRGMLGLKLVSVDYSGAPTSGQLFPRSGGGGERFLPTDFGADFVRLVQSSHG